jgi:proteasome activator subunit 4
MFDALAEGSDPDRMKGALYVLWGKGTGKSPVPDTERLQLTERRAAAYAFADHNSRGRYLTALLECQHQEKVGSLAVCHVLADVCCVAVDPEDRACACD